MVIFDMEYFDYIIKKYKIVDSDEKRALKILDLWIQHRKKVFPDNIHSKFSNKKDPRSTLMFKYCYKLQRETRGILEEKDYDLYVRAQLHMLKYFSRKYNLPCVVDPQCLVGEKAWKRWKFYKYKYDSLKNVSIVKEEKSKINLDVLKYRLLKTKEFLVKKEIKLSAADIKINIKDILLWHKLGNIDVYFLMLCNCLSEKDLESINTSIYHLDDDMKKVYKSVFGDL